MLRRMQCLRPAQTSAAAFVGALAIGLVPASSSAQAGGSRGDRPAAPVVIELTRDRFDWQDAGVGAVGTLALLAIGLGLTLVIRRSGTPPG